MYALATISLSLFGQGGVRKLPTNINHPSINVSVPFMSLDGGSMILLSDNAEDNKAAMFYTAKSDAVNWKDPAMMPKVINNGLNFLKGFTLSPDGKTVYLANTRTGGLGGFDIYKSEQKGNFWGDLTNVGLPLNSKANDASPTFSSDGNTVYFMRCEKMTFDKAEACKMVMSKKNAMGQWQEPTDLPDFINTGNSQSPRIMGDGETLIFSSNKLLQSKGGMDLYMTRWNGSAWSTPIPLDFTNTAADDQFVSATSAGRFLLRDAPGARKSELIEVPFPPQIKPKATMKVEGEVNSPAFISVFNKKDQSRVFNGRPDATGKFILYLNEGAVYDLSVEPEQDKFTFFSKEYDLTREKFVQNEKVNVNLKTLSVGDEIELAGVAFKPKSVELDASSNQDLRRLARMIKGNPTFNYIIDVSLFGYLQDSVQRDADLTELFADTLKFPVSFTQIDTSLADSIKTITRDSVVLRKMYHNNRTPDQAMTIVNYLTGQGIPAKNLNTSHHAVAALPENRKIVVKVIVK